MMQASDVAGLRKALTSHLEFGTAGLRGPMGPGYCCMNELTVVQATQGLAAYLESTQSKEGLATSGVAIGWDHRAAGSLSSERFALLAAEVLPRAATQLRVGARGRSAELNASLAEATGGTPVRPLYLAALYAVDAASPAAATSSPPRAQSFGGGPS